MLNKEQLIHQLNNKTPAFKYAVWAAVIVIAAVIYLLVVTDNQADGADEASQKSVTTNAALSVNAIKVQRATLDFTVPANGNIAAWQEAVIGAEVNGLLLNDVLVNVGDYVKRGQVLAKFSSYTIAADVAQANANLADAKATAIEAAGNANRARSIQNTGALSAQQVEQYIATEASTKARVEAAEASLKLQALKLNQTIVLAPDNGVISSRTATVGSVASAGQELFRLVRQGRLEWRAELTSADVSKIKIGMKAELTLPDGNALQGKVRAIAPSIDSQTRNAIVYVDLSKNTAKAGMYARGKFVLENTEALTLPSSAVVLRDGFSYVMQIEADQKIKQVKVQTGRRVGDLVELLNIENIDGNYVASGGAFLADGDTVKVLNNIENVSEVKDGKFTDYKTKAEH